MSPVAEKHRKTIRQAAERLIARAENARGLSGDDVVERVSAAVEKYLLESKPSASGVEIQTFVEELRADDLCLILACERGDDAAWEDLVANFDSTVKSAARKIASGADDADDLASSIWAELYGLREGSDGRRRSKLSYYSGRGSLGGWLRAVVAQLAVDQFRRVSKFVQVDEDREFEALANEAAASSNGFVSNGSNPEEKLASLDAAADVSRALKRAVSKLEPEDRLILKLYYFEGLKLKDIAETFGYHEATASRRLSRIQSDIRKLVEKELRLNFGWSEAEVKRHLSETAASLGVNLESMLGLLALAAFVQDFWA
jgi:RNA polymerase sigma-70 factor (ECF subfamily)